jgi:deoxyhypusine synthase
MYRPHGLLIRSIKFLHSARDSFAQSILNAPIQMAVAVIPDRITDESIAFQATGVHSRQHRDIRINIVVDPDNTLCVMKSVETPHVLL